MIEAIAGSRIGWKYVGKAFSLVNRKSNHFMSLRKNKHHSIKLQRYYNKYGPESLRFSVLMKCPKTEMKFWEEFFIKCFDSFHNGFNCTEESRGGRNPELTGWLKHIETGTKVFCKAASEFAQEHDMCITMVRRLLNGKTRYAKGWYCPKWGWKPTFKTVIDPNGVTHRIYDVFAFIKEHGLNISAFYNFINGKKDYYRGWSLPDKPSRESRGGTPKKFSLIHESGEIVSGSNYSNLAKDRGMSKASLCRLLKGQSESYKGWRIFNGDNQ